MADNAYTAGKKLFCGAYSSYTPSAMSLFSKGGRYGKVPSKGARIYFYSSSLKRISHVGLVVDVSFDDGYYSIKVIEGNTDAGKTFERDGGEVALKSYKFKLSQVGGTNRINGFGYPKYGDDTCSVDELIECAYSWIGYAEKKKGTADEKLWIKDACPGSDNWTCFGLWYGIKDGQWCEMFQAYIGYQACQHHLTVNRTGWQQEDGKWYYYANGTLVKNRWMFIGERWYAFADDGHAFTDTWFQSDDIWYYLGKDSAMLSSQWFKYPKDGKWYYLEASGGMVVDCYVKDTKGRGYCYLGLDGAWDGKYVIAPNPAKDKVF